MLDLQLAFVHHLIFCVAINFFLGRQLLTSLDTLLLQLSLVVRCTFPFLSLAWLGIERLIWINYVIFSENKDFVVRRGCMVLIPFFYDLNFQEHLESIWWPIFGSTVRSKMCLQRKRSPIKTTNKKMWPVKSSFSSYLYSEGKCKKVFENEKELQDLSLYQLSLFPNHFQKSTN